MRKVLDILEEFLVDRGYKFERLDGMVTGRDRAAAIRRFNDKNSNVFCFLLTTKAGGVGLNLQAADTVIIFDSDWNPQNDIQAMARSHRIGQTKEVKVYRLVTRKTYERQLFQAASFKLGLDIAVLGGLHEDYAKQESGNSSGRKMPLNGEEIENVLKKGAYELLNEDDEAAVQSSKAYAEEDIESILKTSTHQVVYDNQEEGKRGPSTFSQATFISSTSKPDIAVDDPEFWAKMLPQAPTLIEQLTLAIMEDAETASEPSTKEETPSEAGTETETGIESEASSNQFPQLPDLALSTPQGRQQFLNSVRTAAAPIVQARKDGELPEDMEDMLHLLQSVQEHKRFGGVDCEDLQKEVESLKHAIEKPKRRRMQRLHGEDHHWSDESDDDEDGTGNDVNAAEDLTAKQREELRQRFKRQKLEVRKEQRQAAIQQRKVAMQLEREERKRQRQEAAETRKRERQRQLLLKQKQQKELALQRQKQAELARKQKLALQKKMEEDHRLKKEGQAHRSKILKAFKDCQQLNQNEEHLWRNAHFVRCGTVPGVNLPNGKDFVAVFQSTYTGCRLSEVAGMTLVHKVDVTVPMRCMLSNISGDILVRVNNICVLGIPTSEVAKIINKAPSIKILLLRRPNVPLKESVTTQPSTQYQSKEEMVGLDFTATFNSPNFGCIVKKVDGRLLIWSLQSSSTMECCHPYLDSDIVLGVNGESLEGKTLKEVLLLIREASIPRILQLRRPKSKMSSGDGTAGNQPSGYQMESKATISDDALDDNSTSGSIKDEGIQVQRTKKQISEESPKKITTFSF